jgi:hypothetical protein
LLTLEEIAGMGHEDELRLGGLWQRRWEKMLLRAIWTQAGERAEWVVEERGPLLRLDGVPMWFEIVAVFHEPKPRVYCYMRASGLPSKRFMLNKAGGFNIRAVVTYALTIPQEVQSRRERLDFQIFIHRATQAAAK